MTELDVLDYVNQLGPECRAFRIQEDISNSKGKEVEFGYIFTYLDSLCEKGFVTYTRQEGRGRQPRLYSITEKGLKYLKDNS